MTVIVLVGLKPIDNDPLFRRVGALFTQAIGLVRLPCQNICIHVDHANHLDTLPLPFHFPAHHHRAIVPFIISLLVHLLLCFFHLFCQTYSSRSPLSKVGE